jgi:hypothetical protein
MATLTTIALDLITKEFKLVPQFVILSLSVYAWLIAALAVIIGIIFYGSEGWEV